MKTQRVFSAVLVFLVSYYISSLGSAGIVLLDFLGQPTSQLTGWFLGVLVGYFQARQDLPSYMLIEQILLSLTVSFNVMVLIWLAEKIKKGSSKEK